MGSQYFHILEHYPLVKEARLAISFRPAGEAIKLIQDLRRKWPDMDEAELFTSSFNHFLCLAAQRGKEEALRAILQAGCDVNILNHVRMSLKL